MNNQGIVDDEKDKINSLLRPLEQSTVNPREEKKNHQDFCIPSCITRLGKSRLSLQFKRKVYATQLLDVMSYIKASVFTWNLKISRKLLRLPHSYIQKPLHIPQRLAFCLVERFWGRESRDSSVTYQQRDLGQESHLTSLYFRLFTGETRKLTLDANLHECYKTNENHRIRVHTTGLQTPLFHFANVNLTTGPQIRRCRESITIQRKCQKKMASCLRTAKSPVPGALQALALKLGCGKKYGVPGALILPEPKFHYQGPTSAVSTAGEKEVLPPWEVRALPVFLLIPEPKSIALRLPPTGPSETPWAHPGRGRCVSILWTVTIPPRPSPLSSPLSPLQRCPHHHAFDPHLNLLLLVENHPRVQRPDLNIHFLKNI